jgi:hypothetical protein
MRETYSGILTYLPHTWSLHCYATQLKCEAFELPSGCSLTKNYLDIAVGVALVFLGIAYPLVISIST